MKLTPVEAAIFGAAFAAEYRDTHANHGEWPHLLLVAGEAAAGAVHAFRSLRKNHHDGLSDEAKEIITMWQPAQARESRVYPFDEGRAAFRDGLKVDSGCPYEVGSDKRIDWQDGWMRGRAER